MIDPYFFTGRPHNFYNLCNIYPPTINDFLDTKEIGVYRELLLHSQEDISDQWDEELVSGKKPDAFEQLINLAKSHSTQNAPTPFQYLLILAKSNPSLEEQAVKGFKFFIHEDVSFLYDMDAIIIGDLEQELNLITDINQLRLLTEEKYFEFQNLCRQALGEKTIEPPVKDEDPRVARIKKLGRKRDKIAAKKNGIDFGTSLAAICCMGLGINPLNIGEMSKCAIQALTEMFQNREKYDIDIRSLQNGADPNDIKVQYWMKS